MLLARHVARNEEFALAQDGRLSPRSPFSPLSPLSPFSLTPFTHSRFLILLQHLSHILQISSFASMDTSTAAGKRKLQFVKCERCRQDKQKCLPTDRVWPQKCERCIGMGEECSEGARKVRKKRNADYSEPSQSPEPAYAQPAIMPPMPRLAPAPPRIPPPTIQDTGDAYQSDQQVGPSVQETGLDAAQPSEMPTIPQDEEAIPSLPPSVLLNAGNMLPDVSHIPGSNAVADSHAVDIGSTEEGVKALLEDWYVAQSCKCSGGSAKLC